MIPDGSIAAAGVDAFVQRLARAVSHHHTYPPTSSACAEAVGLCAEGLRALDRHMSLDLRILPDSIVIGNRSIGRKNPGVRDLARRLHRANVALVAVDRDASIYDLTRFCRELVRRDDEEPGRESFADTLEKRDVEGIHLTMLQRLEVLDVGVISEERRKLVANERLRLEMAAEEGSAVGHVYAGENGWVRLDPSTKLPSVSLTELAVLVQEPRTLAGMLHQLADRSGKDEVDANEVLAEHFEELTSLYAALDPALMEPMFSRLAHSVLELDPNVRRRLLKKTILPGLLDGQVDGCVLRHFPNLDLAQSLTLLLDLEIAAPEVLTMALDRLDLAPERRMEIQPLLETELRERELSGAASAAPDGVAPMAIERENHKHRVMTVDTGSAKSFREFSAFDLSLDADTLAAIADFSDAIEETDVDIERLRLLMHLLSLRPGQAPPEGTLDALAERLEALADGGRWEELADWAGRLRALAETHGESRSESSDPILAMLAESFQKGMADRLLTVRSTGVIDTRRVAQGVVEAYGATAVPALLSDLEKENAGERRNSLVRLMCDSAASLGPGLISRLDGLEWFAVRNVLRVLGFAGPGYEAVLADHLGHREPRVVREAFQSLARMATPEAVELVARELDNESRELREAAEESLWRFPPVMARARALSLVSDLAFAHRRPKVCQRLLLHLAIRGTADLRTALGALAPLRFRFWRPARARLGLWAWAKYRQVGE